MVPMRVRAPTDLLVEFVERGANLREHGPSARGQAIDTCRRCSLRLSGAQPASRRHARQDWIERARADVIAMFAQLLQHPVSVDSVRLGMMQNVHLPESEKEFSSDEVAHRA